MNEARNTFTKGLNLDVHPLMTSYDTLTDCLNGTLMTFNGNEMMLLNDMGNGRVDTAMLPEGYIPLGTCSHGGFIYIVSYNPFKNLALIGSFPSPERNIDTTELDSSGTQSLSNDSLYNDESIKVNNLTYKSLKPIIRKIFDKVELSPGDKFIVFSNNLSGEYLSDYASSNTSVDSVIRLWKIRLASVLDNKTTELENIKWYDLDDSSESHTYYYIKPTSDDLSLTNTSIDVDSYRSLVNGAYSVFSSKKAGNLSLLISPEAPDAFSASWSAYFNNCFLYSDLENYLGGDTAKELLAKSSIKYVNNKTTYNQTYSDYVTQIEESASESLKADPEKLKEHIKSTINTTLEEETTQVCIPTDIIPSTTIKSLSPTYDIFINSSWVNDDKDINPEGIIVRFVIPQNSDKSLTFTSSVDIYKENDNIYTCIIPFNNTRKQSISKSKESEYKTFSERIKEIDWYKRLEQDLTNETPSINNCHIHRVYLNGYPSTDKGDSKYIISTNNNCDYSENEISSKDITVNSDCLNNFFKVDVPYSLGKFKVPSGISEGDKNYIVDVEVIPYTEAGYFPWISKTLTIDFSRIGKDSLNINKWKYYVSDDTVTVNWGLDAYTLPNKSISKVWLEFYDNNGLVATLILNNLSSYNGEFQTVINLNRSSLYHGITAVKEDGSIINHPGVALYSGSKPTSTLLKEWFPDFDIKIDANEDANEDAYDKYKKAGLICDIEQNGTTYYCSNDAGILYNNFLYGVKIKYKTTNLATFSELESNEILLANRYIWTCLIFNEKYDSVNDFDELNPELQLDLEVTYGSTDTYKAYKANYSNAKNCSIEAIEDASKDNLSANLLYVSGNNNIESRAYITLNNNYSAFRLNSDKLNEISIECAYDNTELSIKDSVDEIEIVQEEVSGNSDNIKSSNETAIVSLTPIQGKLFGTTGSGSELWESPENVNNKYYFSQSEKSGNNTYNYYSSDGEEHTITIPYKKLSLNNSGYVSNTFTFNALYYSKYYTSCNSPVTRTLHVCKSPISSVKDLSKYNITQYTFNNRIMLYYNKMVSVFFDDKGKGSSTHWGATLWSNSITNSDDTLKLTAYELNNWTSDDKGDRSTIDFRQITRDANDVISEIHDACPFLIPIVTFPYRNSPESKLICLSSDESNKLQLNTSSASSSDGKISTNLGEVSGYLGLATDLSLYVDFGHPISHSAGAQNCDIYANYMPYKGDCLTFLPSISTGILTLIYYKTDDTKDYQVYSFDNYTYCKPYYTTITPNIIYKAYVNNENLINDLIIVGNTGNGGFLYSDYLEGLKTSMDVNDIANGNFKLNEITKNCPLQFQFEYQTPDLIKNDFSNKGILETMPIVYHIDNSLDYNYTDFSNWYVFITVDGEHFNNTNFNNKQCNFINLDSTNYSKLKILLRCLSITGYLVQVLTDKNVCKSTGITYEDGYWVIDTSTIPDGNEYTLNISITSYNNSAYVYITAYLTNNQPAKSKGNTGNIIIPDTSIKIDPGDWNDDLNYDDGGGTSEVGKLTYTGGWDMQYTYSDLKVDLNGRLVDFDSDIFYAYDFKNNEFSTINQSSLFYPVYNIVNNTVNTIEPSHYTTNNKVNTYYEEIDIWDGNVTNKLSRNLGLSAILSAILAGDKPGIAYRRLPSFTIPKLIDSFKVVEGVVQFDSYVSSEFSNDSNYQLEVCNSENGRTILNPTISLLFRFNINEDYYNADFSFGDKFIKK